LRRQTLQLRDQQMRDIVGESLRLDAFQIPVPRRADRVAREQALVFKSGQELDDEKGVTLGLLKYETRQLFDVLARAM
jgi:hypothetical protein